MYKAATGIPLYRRNGYLYRQLSAIHGELYDNYIHVYIYIYMCVLSIFSVFLCLWLIWRSLRSWSCFACFLWLLFSWFIGCLVSSVCKLFGRLAACLFHMPTPTFMKTYRSPGSFFWFRYLDQTNAKLKQMPIKITNNAQTVHMFSFYFGGSLQTL